VSLRTEEWFQRLGGELVSPLEDIRRRLGGIRAFVFDWDGVFNAGAKGEGAPSPFSEADSMGQNLLRFGWWLRDGGSMPATAVLTGQHNPSAVQFARRERFHAVYQGFLDKRVALEHFMETSGLTPRSVAFFFDDALDLPVAERVGLRVLVRRAASPLFQRHVVDAGAADYVTGREGGEHAVREAAELLLGLSDLYARVITERAAFGDAYGAYFAERQGQPVQVYRSSEGDVEPVEE
jgi:3-deoxy-D-manno-octulosonate 8-phosphate phosphatase (KDO 8-P phosphatase)